MHVSTLCKIIEKFFVKNYTGIVNVGSKTQCQKDFIIKTMKHLRLKIRKYTLVDYKNLKNYKCSRPKYMLMNSNKLSKLLNIKISN